MPGLTRINRPAEAFPMGATESLRNDHIKALAQDFGGGISEDSLSATVPDPNHSVAIGKDDGIGSMLHDTAEHQVRSIKLKAQLHFQVTFPGMLTTATQYVLGGFGGSAVRSNVMGQRTATATSWNVEIQRFGSYAQRSRDRT
jgi:hypothetical protein